METNLSGYNCHSWPNKDPYSNRPGSCLISKFAFLPCMGRRADRLGHASSSDWAEPTGLDQPKSSRRGIEVNTPTTSDESNTSRRTRRSMLVRRSH
jgi:hypothetical protein